MSNDLLAKWDDRDDEFENSENSENASDLTITEEDFNNLLIAPADWTIGTLYSQIGGQIDLDPAFQRRNVWNNQAKSGFIESLFLGIPIPQILLSAKKGQKSSFLVLDGKQRLLTIKEFLDGKFNNGRKFKLKGLRILKTLEGKTWKDIKNDSTVAGNLLNETLRTAVLRGWESENVLYEIFYRLNSGSVKLSPMELRTSLYPGKFLKFIIAWTETIGPLHQLLRKTQPDPRMADVELSVRHLAFADPTITYNGDLKDFLDSTCVAYNEIWDENFEKQLNSRLDQMNAAIKVGVDSFGDKRFCRKFVDGQFESRFNRAIFDVLVLSLAHDEFRAWAITHPTVMVEAFCSLSSDNNSFIRSIETTTKSVDATRTRFTEWYGAIKKASGIEIEMPEIK